MRSTPIPSPVAARTAEDSSCSVSQLFRSAGASESRTARNIALLTLHVDRGLDSQALPRPRHGHNPKPPHAGRCEGSDKRRCYVFETGPTLDATLHQFKESLHECP
jgi:hypothetical protein